MFDKLITIGILAVIAIETAIVIEILVKVSQLTNVTGN